MLNLKIFELLPFESFFLAKSAEKIRIRKARNAMQVALTKLKKVMLNKYRTDTMRLAKKQ